MKHAPQPADLTGIPAMPADAMMPPSPLLPLGDAVLLAGIPWHIRLIQGALLAIALLALLIAILLSPDWVAARLSADGHLTAGTITAIQAGRVVCLMMAVLSLVIAARPAWIQDALAAAIAGNTGIGPAAFYGTVAIALLLGAGFLISAVTGTDIGYLLRDPNAIAQLPFYYGALEYAGIMLMAMAGGIAIFAGTMLSGNTRRFLVMGGLLTLLLVCDDLYMIHENSSRFHLNERVTFAAYGLLALLFALVNFRHLLNSPFILLGISAIFFALALLVDGVPGLDEHLPRGTEDMVELAGICFWSTYFMKHSRDLLRRARG